MGWALWALVVHEVWVLMQHGNVLLNPYLQRLDRDYGIALLRKRMYSVIAAVLAAYWAGSGPPPSPPSPFSRVLRA